MSGQSVSIEVIDDLEKLRANNRLLNELSFHEKCIKLLENYRNSLNSFCNNCKCYQNIKNKSISSDLESQYKSIFNKNVKQVQCLQNELNIEKNQNNIKVINQKTKLKYKKLKTINSDLSEESFRSISDMRENKNLDKIYCDSSEA